MLKKHEFLNVFRGTVFIGKFEVRAARCVIFSWLVGGEITGWHSRNLVLCLKLPSSTQVGALVSAKELNDILLRYISWGGTRTLLVSALLLLTVPPLFLFREGPSLISNCLNLPFVTQGRSRRWKPFPADKKWGMQEDFGTLEPTASCSVSLPFREMLLSTGAETWQKPVEDVRSRETYFRWEILPYVIYWCE